MQRQYFRLICKDGTVYTCNEEWPNTGKENIRGIIWLIGYESEIVESFHGLTKTIRPERYYVLMRDAAGMHGIKNPGMCPECQPLNRAGCPACPEETQVHEIPADNVARLCRTQGFNDAIDMFGKMMNTLNQDLIPPGPDPDLDEQINSWVDERFPRLKQFCEVDRILAKELVELIEVVQAEETADDDDDDDDEEPVVAKPNNGSTEAPRA